MNKLFHYLDYQVYLRDFYEHKKRANPYFSYRYMGSKVDLDPGFLVKVLQGKMHLSPKSIPKFARFLGLQKTEKEYFGILVRYNRAKTQKDIKTYFEKLCEFKTSRFYKMQSKQYMFYQKWYYSSIWMLLIFHEFKGDYTALARKLDPPITVNQAKESIKLLLSLGLIQKDAQGKYTAVEKFITSGEKWKSTAIQSYQHTMMDMAKRSLEKQHKDIRDISTATLVVAKDDFEDIRLHVNELRRQLLQMQTDKKKADSIYQVNIQIFPLTKMNGEGQA